jgi:hypothetical protein
MTTITEIENDDSDEMTKRDEFFESILGVSTIKTTTFTLSWGGPADYIEIDQDENGDVVAGRYIYANWGDVAKIELNEDELNKMADLLEPFIVEE